MQAWGERRERLPLKWPFPEAVETVRRKALSRPEFDPASLVVWGQLQAVAILELVKAVERRFGAEGQELCRQILNNAGRQVANQMLEGVELPSDLSDVELNSLFYTWINEVVFCSVEDASVDGPDACSFHIVYCPYEDYYGKFDCRINRYFVEGILDAAVEKLGHDKLHLIFDYSMQQGQPTCHFHTVRRRPEDPDFWREYGEQLQRKALERAQADLPARG
jgi:hypothetical protein